MSNLLKSKNLLYHKIFPGVNNEIPGGLSKIQEFPGPLNFKMKIQEFSRISRRRTNPDY